MNYVCLIFFIISLASCASKKDYLRISNENYDFLKDESYLRYDEKRLNNIKKPSCQDLLNKRDFSKLSVQDLVSKANCLIEENEDINTALNIFQLAAMLTNNKRMKSIIENNKAHIALIKNQFHMAEKLFYHSLKYMPSAKVPKYNLILLYVARNKFSASWELLNSLDKNAFLDPDFAFLKSYIFYRQGYFKKSLNTISKIDIKFQRNERFKSLYILSKYRLDKTSEILHEYKNIKTKHFLLKEDLNAVEDILSNVKNREGTFNVKK